MTAPESFSSIGTSLQLKQFAFVDGQVNSSFVMRPDRTRPKCRLAAAAKVKLGC
jgi:ATP phosphoribosyltransferase regulatory subunit HisZ